MQFNWALKSCLLSLVVTASACAGTITFANGSNTTLGTAQPVSLSPNLVINQVPPNFTYSTAQPVSPMYQAADALGSISNSIAQEFFALAVSQGDHISMKVSSADPPTQFPELLLYDQNGNLVAIANGNAADGSSSQIDFTIPSGGSGNWAAEVTGSPSVPDPSTNLFNYDLRISSPIRYSTDVLGTLTDPGLPGFYAISGNAGDHLHLFVKSGNPPTQFPELFLYDQNGNLVAIANGNAADGSSSVIDFTIPSGGSGNWVAEVMGSPSVPNPDTNLFDYDLLIQGATGRGPIDPVAAQTSVPEPSTFGFAGIALGGLTLLRLRRGGIPSQFR